MKEQTHHFDDLIFLPASLAIFDRFGKLVFVNRMFRQSYLLVDEEVPNIQFSQLFDFSFGGLLEKISQSEVVLFEAKMIQPFVPNRLNMRASKMNPNDFNSLVMVLVVSEKSTIDNTNIAHDEVDSPPFLEASNANATIFNFNIFKQLVKSLPFGMVILDSNDTVLDVNPGFLMLFGYENMEIIGLKISELIIPEAYKAEGILMNHAVIAGKTVSMETRRLHAKGFEIDVLVTGIPIGIEDGVTLIFGIYRDNSHLMKIQRELEREKKHFQSTFENLPFGAILINKEGKVVEMNRAFSEMFGYTFAEINRESVLNDIVADELFEQANKERQKVFSGEKVFFETLRKHSNGSLIDVAITANRVDGVGDSELFLATYEDISDRKKLEKAVREQKRELESIVHFLPGMIYRCDLSEDYWMFFVSYGSKRITGYHPEEFIERKVGFAAIILEEYRQALWDQWQKVQINKTDFQAEYRIMTKDGSVRWVWERGRPVYDEAGNAIFLEGYIEDITEFKILETSLNTEHDLLQALMNNIPDTIYFKDRQSRFIRVNAAQAATLGVSSPSEAIGKTDANFFDSQHSFKSLQDELALMESGQPLVNQQEFILTSKGWRWFTASKVPFRNHKGEITGLVGVSRDITPIKMLEKQLLENEADLKKINTEKDKIFSVIAHDLRSPFNSFLLLTEILDKESTQFDPEELKNLAHSMFKAAKSVSELLENLLSWSTIQRDQVTLYLQPVSLRDVVDRTLDYYEAQMASKKIKSTVDVDVFIHVRADAGVLGTILRNLISNAIKFSNLGGKVEINAKRIENQVKITVSDTGIGIPQNQKEQLFLFETKARRGTQGEASSGLGLVLVKEFVERLGGTIDYESEEGVGTSFFFFLQAAE